MTESRIAVGLHPAINTEPAHLRPESLRHRHGYST
jgi:hypothetical protein